MQVFVSDARLGPGPSWRAGGAPGSDFAPENSAPRFSSTRKFVRLEDRNCVQRRCGKRGIRWAACEKRRRASRTPGTQGPDLHPRAPRGAWQAGEAARPARACCCSRWPRSWVRCHRAPVAHPPESVRLCATHAAAAPPPPQPSASPCCGGTGACVRRRARLGGRAAGGRGRDGKATARGGGGLRRSLRRDGRDLASIRRRAPLPQSLTVRLRRRRRRMGCGGMG